MYHFQYIYWYCTNYHTCIYIHIHSYTKLIRFYSSSSLTNWFSFFIHNHLKCPSRIPNTSISSSRSFRVFWYIIYIYSMLNFKSWELKLFNVYQHKSSSKQLKNFNMSTFQFRFLLTQNKSPACQILKMIHIFLVFFSTYKTKCWENRGFDKWTFGSILVSKSDQIVILFNYSYT